MWVTRRINTIVTSVNSSDNSSSETKLYSFDDSQDGEHNGVCFMEISHICGSGWFFFSNEIMLNVEWWCRNSPPAQSTLIFHIKIFLLLYQIKTVLRTSNVLTRAGLDGKSCPTDQVIVLSKQDHQRFIYLLRLNSKTFNLLQLETISSLCDKFGSRCDDCDQ